MGILQRAEIISKNIAFSKKADLFYRVRRLIDENQMGELFKVMLVKNKKNNFSLKLHGQTLFKAPNIKPDKKKIVVL